jgi:hypothetical protein
LAIAGSKRDCSTTDFASDKRRADSSGDHDQGIKRLFEAQPDREWRDHIETVATDKTKKI